MKMSYSESDTRANFIDPQLKNSKWEAHNIKREYYFTDGRKTLWNKRWDRKFADYLFPWIIQESKYYLNQRVWRIRTNNDINFKYI